MRMILRSRRTPIQRTAVSKLGLCLTEAKETFVTPSQSRCQGSFGFVSASPSEADSPLRMRDQRGTIRTLHFFHGFRGDAVADVPQLFIEQVLHALVQYFYRRYPTGPVVASLPHERAGVLALLFPRGPNRGMGRPKNHDADRTELGSA